RFRATVPTEQSFVRLFDNSGNPTSTNIDLAVVLGDGGPAGVGNRGDGIGFHGNGNDAYVLVVSSGGNPWVSVLNTNGTLRYSHSVAQEGETLGSDRVDGAITPDGRVIAVWSGFQTNTTTLEAKHYIQARMYNAAGEPSGDRFVV